MTKPSQELVQSAVRFLRSPQNPDLMSWIGCQPDRVAPKHLRAVVTALETFDTGNHRLLVSCPPRHGKSETICAGFAWLLLRNPKLELAYLTYGAKLSRMMSSRIRDIYVEFGGQVSKTMDTASEWKTDAGGCLLADGINGSLTGRGFNGMAIDDPLKSRLEAESLTYRDRTMDAISAVGRTRLRPRGSLLVNHTRWHVDDPIGRLSGKGNWVTVNLPAIGLDGKYLWSDVYDDAYYLSLQESSELSEYDFASLYQGTPRPRGGTVFQDPTILQKLPDGCRYVIGADLNYSEKSTSDYSAAVVLAQNETSGTCCVVDVVRRQTLPEHFAADLKRLQDKWHGARIVWHLSGTEQAALSLFRSFGVEVDGRPARADKFIRAQPVATSWNRGQVQVLASDAPWVQPFISEVLNFTGQGGREKDDQVDALSSAFDGLQGGLGPVVGKPREVATRFGTGRLNAGRMKW